MGVTQIPAAPSTATASTPGAAPHWPPTLADIGLDSLASGTFPAFVANAASIAPGTDKASSYTIEAARTLAAGATLTLATTDTPVTGNYVLVCKALNLGYAITVTNGGAGGGNLGSGFAASYTKPRIMMVWYDGTNFIFNGYSWINP